MQNYLYIVYLWFHMQINATLFLQVQANCAVCKADYSGATALSLSASCKDLYGTQCIGLYGKIRSWKSVSSIWFFSPLICTYFKVFYHPTKWLIDWFFKGGNHSNVGKADGAWVFPQCESPRYFVVWLAVFWWMINENVFWVFIACTGFCVSFFSIYFITCILKDNVASAFEEYYKQYVICEELFSWE